MLYEDSKGAKERQMTHAAMTFFRISFCRKTLCQIGLTLTTLAFLWLLPAWAGAVPASSHYQVQSVYPIPNGSGAGRVLWVKPGTSDTGGNYSGDIASIWSVDAGGNATAIGPAYGPFPGWKVQSMAVAADGTTRLQWEISGVSDTNGTYTGDTVSVWTLDQTGKVTAIGPAYGPYPSWRDEGFDVAPDNTTRLFWNKQGTTTNGTYGGDTVTVYTLDRTGTKVGTAPVYGPYSGWRTYNYQIANDSTGRLFWTYEGTTMTNSDFTTTYSGDTVTIWALDAGGRATAIGPAYGPFSGWRGFDFQIASDNTTRLLWTYEGSTDAKNNYSGNTVSLWAFNAAGKETVMGPSYGPYPGWRGEYFEIASDNTTRLFWDNSGTYSNGNGTGAYSGDQVSLWTLNTACQATANGPAYGPFPGWHTNEFSLAPDNTARLLWSTPGTTDTSGNYSGDTVSLWSLDTSGRETAIGQAYGPYPGWRVSFAYPVTNSVTDLLWLHDTPGSASYGYSSDQDEVTLWTLNTANAQTATGPVYGPYN
jgi:hypothetical protein